MATLISKANGNLTGAATFAAAEIGAGALNLIRFSHTSAFAAAASLTSAAFTVTNAKVIDGVLLYVRQSQAGSTGTFKVALHKGGVEQASVTVNKADLAELYGVTNAPTFFKFTGTATGDGAANWTIVVTTTGTGTVNYSITASGATNFTRALRTTTNATPAAADDMYVVGELTGAGTHNSFTVTMDSIAATVYGNGTVSSTTVNGGMLGISCYGTLTYGTTAGTNYILRLAGNVDVYQFGTLNIGSAGAEIPRNSTAVLEFQPVSADGDFGLVCRENSIINMAGLSRTAGKNIVKCKLTADVVSDSVITSQSFTGAALTYTGVEATGNSALAGICTENTATTTHGAYFSGPSVTNTVQTAVVWLARGVGPANNRYVRMAVGNNATFTSITNGFYTDLDLQAGTASGPTAIGTGVATSVSIVAQGAGWLVKMTGKVATTAATPSLLLNACSALGTVTYPGTSQQNFVFSNVGLVIAASLPDTVFNVDTDTGWLSGDTIGVSSTSRTGAESEPFTLNANAGASAMTSALYPNPSLAGVQAFRHSGAAPTQAEIILLTRNVAVRSTSMTLSAYVYVLPMATFTASWVEFFRLGTTSASRRGIEIDGGATTNPKSITYCSLHDFDANGLYCATASVASLNVTFSHNTLWMTGTTVTISGTVTNTDWTFDDNVIMRAITSGFSLGDIGGVCTNNIVCGQLGNGEPYTLSESSTAIGTFANNTAHSGGAPALSVSGVDIVGEINNFTAWRSTGAGVDLTGINHSVVFNDLILFGNTTNNFTVPATSGTVTINDAAISGDTLFSTTNGINATGGGASWINLNDVDMSGVGTGLVPHTGTDITFGANTQVSGQINNCKFGAPTLAAKTNWSNSSYIGFEKYNQVAGDHRCEMTFGQLRTDTAVFNTFAPSMRMTPNNTTNKLESAPKTQGAKVPVANGSSVGVSVLIRKSTAGEFSNYGGSQPRLVVRANHALGVNADTVLATDSSASSTTTGFFDQAATNFAISGGGLVATCTLATTDAGCKVVDGVAVGKSSGKHYWELNITAIPGLSLNGFGFGIGTPGSTYPALASSATTGVIYFPAGGQIWTGGSNSGISLGTRVAGDTVGMAVDLDNRLMWFRVAPSGNWNASGTANPATGVGGIPIPAGIMTALLAGANSVGMLNNVFTANFGGSTFVGAVPAGFASGWLVATNAGSWVTLSATSPVATDDGVFEFIIDCDGATGWINVDDWAFSGVATTAPGLKNWHNGVPAILLAGGATLAITQDDQTLVAAGGPVLGCALAVTQADETLVAAGGPVLDGALTVTQAAQTLSATGSVVVAGELTASQDDHTLDASGAVGVELSIGSLVITQDDQTLAAAGEVAVAGALVATQANETLIAAGSVSNVAIGTLTKTQAPQTLVATGAVLDPVTGTLTRTQAPQTLVATALAAAMGTLARTQAPQTLAATGRVAVAGVLTEAQAPQTLVAIGRVTVAGALVETQAPQTFVGAGAVDVAGALVGSQAPQTLIAAGQVAVTATLTRTQAPQTVVGAGAVAVAGALTQVQAPQTLTAAGQVAVVGVLAETQADQTLVAAGGPVVAGVLTQAQVPQTLVAAGQAVVGGALTVVQADETLAAAGVSAVVGDLTVTQAPQVLAGAGGPSVVASLTVTQANQTLAAQKHKILQVMPLYGHRAILLLDGDASQITPLTGHRSGIELEGDTSQVMALRGRRSGMNLQGSAS